MMSRHTVNILPHVCTIEVEEGGNLLASLIEHSIFLRSDCGGRGVCGKCSVELMDGQGHGEKKEACTLTIHQNIDIKIPQASMLSSYIIQKAPAALPTSFLQSFKSKAGATAAYGVAIDLGTTTIALYLCNMASGTILSTLSVKNPQALYGDDVMSRIGEVARDRDSLLHQQKLVVKTIEWGCKKLVRAHKLLPTVLEKMVVVGNPVMVHIFLGVDPHSIGVAPYQPVFYEARSVEGQQVGFDELSLAVYTLPQVSGFIGGDILAVAVAAEIENQPPGTLIVDIGTNGELIYKGKYGLYATSCATGPAFEGASLSCGMQAIPGAIDKVIIRGRSNAPEYTLIKNINGGKSPYPEGLCGSGVISAAAELCRVGVIDSGGAFVKDCTIGALSRDSAGTRRYIIVENDTAGDRNEVAISQKDIRSIQLGKAALISGIEFLLKKEGTLLPEKIIIAGAFGSHLDKEDMMTLGVIPRLLPSQIEVSGNLAGAGAVMALCDDNYIEQAKELASKIQVVDLAASLEFQQVFVERLGFPKQFQV